MDAQGLIERAEDLRSDEDGGPDRWHECKDILVRAVALARQEDDKALLSRALTALGRIERDKDAASPATYACYQEAALAARSAGAKYELAHALRHMGELKREFGSAAEALPLHNEALELYRACDAGPLDLANTLRGVGLDQEALGDRAAAKAAWEEAGELYAEFCRRERPTWDIETFSGVVEARERVASLS